MPLAKRLGARPRDLAAELVDQLDLDGFAEASVAGSGFINVRLDDAWIGRTLAAVAAADRLGAGVGRAPQRVVVDYSAPNIAKEMHVGHLRSTIIGDALGRVLRFLGDDVVAQNHVGDWGTQFGMLIEQLGDDLPPAGQLGDDVPPDGQLGDEVPPDGRPQRSIADLDAFYRQARAHFDADPAFADRARARVVALQSGDPSTLAAWRALVDESRRHFDVVYRLLGVSLEPADMAGESAYNDLLPGTVDALAERGLLELDGGALCAFPAGFANREGDRMPLIVRKSDGGYTYASTDLAAIRHRAETLDADRILYVVGAPQRQHLQMVFALARAAGWIADPVVVEHVAFGSVLGDDGRILRSRAGENVKLVDLLLEAVRRAAEAIAQRTPAPDDALARQVGIGAVKYADLSTDRVKDYVFDFDRMLSLEGNTSVYLQYAHARVSAVVRRAAAGRTGARDHETPPLGVDQSERSPAVEPGERSPAVEEGERRPCAAAALPPRHDAERALALALLQFGSTVDLVATTLAPHRLCTYLYATAAAFSAFYEQCPILTADDPLLSASRLELARHAGRVLRTGLDLLGIETPERL
jgi:arginyl-tRNA synthetase